MLFTKQIIVCFFFFVILEVLHAYKSANNELPGSIIIYRDGVGDSQLSYVHKIELVNIKVSTYFEY